MGAVQAAVALISVIDVLFITLRFGPTHVVAGYQLAATLTRAPLFLALALATAAFPQLARRPGDRAVLSAHTQHVVAILLPLLAVTATLPGSILKSVLPAGYDSAIGFLPLTATLSTAYGLVVLQTTVFRADGRARECVMILTGACLTSLVCMAVGSLFGVYGLVAGALLGALCAVCALAIQTERRWRGAQRLDVRPLLAWPAVAVVLVFARQAPWLWVALASVVALQIVRSALNAPDRAVPVGALEQ
jgi:O-antigen/teichoic acid export membrane protein